MEKTRKYYNSKNEDNVQNEKNELNIANKNYFEKIKKKYENQYNPFLSNNNNNKENKKNKEENLLKEKIDLIISKLKDKETNSKIENEKEYYESSAFIISFFDDKNLSKFQNIWKYTNKFKNFKYGYSIKINLDNNDELIIILYLQNKRLVKILKNKIDRANIDYINLSSNKIVPI